MKIKSRILSGALMLFSANLIVKLAGAVYKIPLQRILTDTGMGYFNVAYSIYTWFYLISTAGLPIAVSVCIAKALAEGDRVKAEAVYRVSALIFSSFGALCSLSMAVFAGHLSRAASLDNARLCIVAAAPSVFLSSVSAAVRGYYQGHGIMWVTAVSQLIEALGKLFFGLALARISAGAGSDLFVTASHAVIGISCGALLSALFCVSVKTFYKRIRAGTNAKIYKGTAREVMRTALPVTLSASVMNLVSLSDVFTAPALLVRSGYTQLQSAAIYGNYSTVCTSLINLPMMFVYPVCGSVLPALSSAIQKNDRKRAESISAFAYRTVYALVFPCAVGLAVLSYEIPSLIFPETSAALAAPMLAALCPSLMFSCTLSVTDTILQAAGRAGKTVISMACGSAAKMISTVLLFMYSSAGRLSIPAGTCVCYAVSALMNIVFLRGSGDPVPSAYDVIKPALCSVICGLTAGTVFTFAGQTFYGAAPTIIATVSAAAVYSGALTVTGYTKTIFDGIRMNNKEKDHKNDRIREKREVQL